MTTMAEHDRSPVNPHQVRFPDVPAARAHVASLRGRPLQSSGDWSPAQNFYHLAAAIEVGLDAPVVKPTLWTRLTKWPLKMVGLGRGLGRGLPKGVKFRRWWRRR